MKTNALIDELLEAWRDPGIGSTARFSHAFDALEAWLLLEGVQCAFDVLRQKHYFYDVRTGHISEESNMFVNTVQYLAEFRPDLFP